MEEVCFRGGQIIAVVIGNDNGLIDELAALISVSVVDEDLLPIVTSIPMHLLACYVMVLQGTDVHQPTNLTNSAIVD